MAAAVATSVVVVVVLLVVVVVAEVVVAVAEVVGVVVAVVVVVPDGCEQALEEAAGGVVAIDVRGMQVCLDVGFGQEGDVPLVALHANDQDARALLGAGVGVGTQHVEKDQAAGLDSDTTLDLRSGAGGQLGEEATQDLSLIEARHGCPGSMEEVGVGTEGSYGASRALV